MSRIFDETEHQEMFTIEADLRKPIPLHIPSALACLGYYICLLVPETMADRLSGVTSQLIISGLRPDDLTLKSGDGIKEQNRFPSKTPGFCWALLCRAMLSRGDGTLSLQGLPDGLDRATVLLCTWPRFLESGQADDWLAVRHDPLMATGGIPLGGIGTGKIELCRDGRFRNFSGNNNQDMPFEEPDGLDGAYLAVTVDGQERVLATRPMCGLQPVPSLAADLRFPQICLTAKDAFPGIDVELLASGTIVPHDIKTSCMPAVLFRWTVRNNGSKPVRVTCRLAWPNLIGQGGGIGEAEKRTGYADGYYRFWEAPKQHQAETVVAHGWKALIYGNAPSTVCTSADGHHYVTVRTATGEESQIASDPCLGSASFTAKVAPSAHATADMALVWAMPHWVDTNGKDQGLYWQNYVASGKDILNLVFAEFDRILHEAGALAALILETDLPVWLRKRLSNCCYPLVTNSVLFKDGRFSINEGPTEMSGCYGTLDQRLGAHPATQLLFPELNRQELAQFAKIQSPDGSVNHDFGCGQLDSGPKNTPWPDLTCAFILQLARHCWTNGDTDFEREVWPCAKKALDRHRLWAEEGDGVAQVGYGLGTSYDGYHYYGTTPYMATLWIATLRVMQAWAKRMNDLQAAINLDNLAAKALTRMEADLWNGRYYRAYKSAKGDVNENCHAGMLAGEWYARMLAGMDVLPTARLAACSKALVELNGNSRFAIPPDEVAPDASSCSDFGWLPYVESFGLAPLAVLGEPRTMDIWERIIKAMDGGGMHPCDTRLMYRPMNGEPSWGAYYMTAPASWLVYDAMLDFMYTPENGTLRLNPKLTGKFAVVHPLFWGVGERTEDKITLTIHRVFGKEKLFVRQVETREGSGTPRGVYVRRAIPAAELIPGTTLSWSI